MKKQIASTLKEIIATHEKILSSQLDTIAEIADQISECLKKKGKVILFGNGGSAADSQHIAAELVGRFQKERRPLPALALTVNTSILTALGNDYGYEYVFSKQVEALAKKGDVVIGISTSGNAKNVIEGIKLAKRMGAITIALSGCDGGKLSSLADIAFIVPSKVTARIQEAHIAVGHIVCELIETNLFLS